MSPRQWQQINEFFAGLLTYELPSGETAAENLLLLYSLFSVPVFYNPNLTEAENFYNRGKFILEDARAGNKNAQRLSLYYTSIIKSMDYYLTRNIEQEINESIKFLGDDIAGEITTLLLKPMNSGTLDR